MPISRQKIALQFIERSGGAIGKLDLVKLMFLVSKEGTKLRDAGTFYQFLPYKRGPFSFALYNELNALARDQHIALEDLQVSMVKPALSRFCVEPEIQREVDSVWGKYGGMTTDQKVEHVYSAYPWYTVNSEWKERRKMSLPVADVGVYTVGYEGLQIDGFLDLLLRAGIKTIIDVRANPVSRKYGFHKSTLVRISGDVGIDYRHYPQVGIPAAWRTDLMTSDDYLKLFDRYEREILPGQDAVVVEIAGIMAKVPSVLVCQEKDPSYCHRTRLARALSTRCGLSIDDLRSA